MRDFHDLEVWSCSHALTLAIYKATVDFPRHELYGLTSQIRRAAVSIEANVAEGAGKNTNADFARFLQISFASASELECELLIAKDLGYLPERCHADLTRQVSSIKKMLTRFMQYLHGDKQVEVELTP